MTNNRRILAALFAVGAMCSASTLSAQIDLPSTAATAGKDAPSADTYDEPLLLSADLGSRRLTVSRGGSILKTYAVAVGSERYPTPPGTYTIRKIVWNPSWRPPPDAAWARG